MDTYSAAQVAGKTLWAKKTVQLRRYAEPNAPVVFTVKPGNQVGRVDAWVGGRDGRPLWWSFRDQYDRPYYALHEPNTFSIEELRDQGAVTVKEQTEAEKKAAEEAAKSPFDKVVESVSDAAGDTTKTVTNVLMWGGLIVGGIVLLSIVNRASRPRRPRGVYYL